MQRFVSTPVEYMAAVPEAQRPLLQHLRSLILEAAPDLHEGIRYGALCYEDRGALFGLAAQKHHVGLYVMAPGAIRDLAPELKSLKHGKGCFRFQRLEQVPTEVISKLLHHAKESHERECHPAPS
jgi:uncharacterized protein YdhG (YjbR/CyaY superfamily)